MKTRYFIFFVISLLILSISVMGYAEENIITTENNEIEDHDITSFGEAPEFGEMVADGDLPDVEKRLPEDPYVVKPNEKIGEYGGTLRSATTTMVHAGEDTMIMDAFNSFVKPNAEANEMVANFAKKIESSDDKTEYTIYLRNGVKWSDGEPFTTEDIMFWYEDVLQNEDITPIIPEVWEDNGELVEIEVIDDFTFKMKFAAPRPFFPNRLVHQGGGMLFPKHYLKQFHPQYVDEEDLETKVKEENFDNWWELFEDKNSVWSQQPLNPDRPTLTAYKLVEMTSSRRVYERNPYFWKVDSEGNQLPYIERIETDLVSDREVLNGRIMSGELDFAGFETDIRNYPMFKQYEDEGGYKTLLWESGMASEVIYMVNQTIEDDDLREIFQEKKFRQALSLAIDREEINESIYFGRAEPRQYTVLDTSQYFEEDYAKAFTEFDQNKAKELLDEIGLEDQNGDGWRDFSNGEKFTFTLEYYPSETPKSPNVELVTEHWREIGLDVNSKEVSGELQDQRATGNMMEATIWHGDKASDVLFPVGNNLIIPKAPSWDTAQWVEWARWINTNGEEGMEPSSKVKQLDEWYDEMLVEPDEDKRIELGKKILESQAENLWVIGTIGNAPWVAIANENLKNVPENVIWAWDTGWSMLRDPEQFYFEGGTR